MAELSGLEFDGATVFNISQNVVSRVNTDGTISLMTLTDDDFFYKIDGIAAEVWKLMGEKKPLNDIVEKLIIEKNPPKEKFLSDVNGYLKELIELKLIATK